MEDKKLLEVLDCYERDFKESDIPEIKHPHDQYFSSSYDLLAHCHSMLKGIREFLSEGGKEKRDRALKRAGFIEGCLVATRQFTVQDLKNLNKPDQGSANTSRTLEPLTSEDLKDWEY